MMRVNMGRDLLRGLSRVDPLERVHLYISHFPRFGQYRRRGFILLGDIFETIIY